MKINRNLFCISLSLHYLCSVQMRKDAGVDERTALEMRRTGNRTGGSNPSLSALPIASHRGAISERKENESCPITTLYESAGRAGEYPPC